MQDQDDNLEFDDDFIGDEFDDDLALDGLDDDILDDEAWDDNSLPSLEANSSPQASVPTDYSEKKKFPLNFNTIIIGGAVILGSLVLYFQVIKDKSAENQPQKFVSSLGVEGATSTLVDNNIIVNDINVEKNEIVQNHGAGFLNDNMDELPEEYFIEQDVDDLPMPTPVSEDVSMTDNRVSIADNLKFVTETQGEVVDSKPLQQIDNLSIIDSGKNSKISKDENIIVGSNEVGGASNGVALLNINQKLDIFLDRMGGLESKIDMIDDASNQRAALIEDSVKSLENQIKSIKKTRVSRSTPIKRSVSNNGQTNKIEWQLKAAQPGKAWISQKGKAAIISVKVGDTVDEIGKIKSISLVGNSWGIMGSYGEIRQ